MCRRLDITWLSLMLLSLVLGAKHLLHHIDPKEEHKETLIWAVTIAPHVSDPTLYVASLAEDLDADVLSTCNVVEQCYIVAHRNHSTGISKSNPEIYSDLHSHLNYHSKINYTIDITNMKELKAVIHSKLKSDRNVAVFSEIWIRSRSKRAMLFHDPMYKEQWHLVNNKEHHRDINVTGVWERNVTGRGVTVAIVDDGLEWDNPDLRDNYNAGGSWDLDSGDNDPMPIELVERSYDYNSHGTRCAGEVAAVPNSVCAVGVAYGSKVAGIRVLDGPMTDAMEASAFTMFNNINDIYSCSWGPQDDGITVDGPHQLAKAALVQGVSQGRKGYGSIYVLASGNGGFANDNCNFDGYANSIYTLTIGAIDEYNKKPVYAEDCAAMLAVTFSSGTSGGRAIVTTDILHAKGRSGCTNGHTGTSAAAPIAAAMVALMLDVRPCLGWRDIQHIVAITAVKVDAQGADWVRNAAGLHHSHTHGFGLMDAWRLVTAAKVWKRVPLMATAYVERIDRDIQLLSGTSVELSHYMSEDMVLRRGLVTLEYVQVEVNIGTAIRGNIVIRLRCPSGTTSDLATARPNDKSTNGFLDWAFSTVRCWGEEAAGNYTLTIEDVGSKGDKLSGLLRSWSLILRGSSMTPHDVQEQIKLANSAASGEFLHDSVAVDCSPIQPPSVSSSKDYVSDRVLKILAAIGCMLLLMAIYEIIEITLLRKMCVSSQPKESSNGENLVRDAHDLGEAYGYAPVSTSMPIEEVQRRGAEMRADEVSGFVGGHSVESLDLPSSELPPAEESCEHITDATSETVALIMPDH